MELPVPLLELELEPVPTRDCAKDVDGRLVADMALMWLPPRLITPEPLARMRLPAEPQALPPA